MCIRDSFNVITHCRTVHGAPVGRLAADDFKKAIKLMTEDTPEQPSEERVQKAVQSYKDAWFAQVGEDAQSQSEMMSFQDFWFLAARLLELKELQAASRSSNNERIAAAAAARGHVEMLPGALADVVAGRPLTEQPPRDATAANYAAFDRAM